MFFFFLKKIRYLEGASNPAIGGHYFSGLPRAVWWAGVTITTVGYGDVVPVTRVGRVFSMVWMFVGMITVGYLSGIKYFDCFL